MVAPKHEYEKIFVAGKYRIDIKITWGFNIIQLGLFAQIIELEYFELAAGLLNFTFLITVWTPKVAKTPWDEK